MTGSQAAQSRLLAKLSPDAVKAYVAQVFPALLTVKRNDVQTAPGALRRVAGAFGGWAAAAKTAALSALQTASKAAAAETSTGEFGLGRVRMVGSSKFWCPSPGLTFML